MTDTSTQTLFSADEIEAIDARFPDGVSAGEVIALFQARGVRLSEATFRKYIQLGLLPTSKRVGRKGKHRGSRGVYPTAVIRRINRIKLLMDGGMTLEEIRDSFLSIQYEIERVSDAFESLFLRIEERIERLAGSVEAVKPISRDIASTREGARALIERIERIGSRLAVTEPGSASGE